MRDTEVESGSFLVGQQIYLVGFDFAFSLLTNDKVDIKIEGAFWLSLHSTEPIRVEPSTYAPAAGNLVSLHFSVIAKSEIISGELRLSFDNGISIQVDSDPAYEAWTISGPRGLLVSQAGGEVSYYPPASRGE